MACAECAIALIDKFGLMRDIETDSAAMASDFIACNIGVLIYHAIRIVALTFAAKPLRQSVHSAITVLVFLEPR